MIDLMNILIMIATIAFGAIGWLAPKYTMNVLHLKTGETTLGMSEVRAASGALFIGMGLAAIIMNNPIAYAIVGFAYAGAAIGRLTSIIIDKSGHKISYSFCATEVAFAVFLIGANLA